MLRLFLILMLLLSQLTGCAWSPGLAFDSGDFESDESAESEPEPLPVTLIPITPSLIETQSKQLQTSLPVNNTVADVPEYEYRVGPQDVLNIIVWDHPELTIPTGGQRPAEEDGHRVSSKGTIFYPYVGIVDVAGKTTEQIREVLTDRLSKYIRKPQLDVRVVGFNSQKVQVAGAVEKPDSYPITDVALMLSDAVNIAGGNNERADIQSVILTRNGENTRYNLIDRYYRGDASEDIQLRNEDIVYVPANNVHKVFVMGEVETQASLPLIDGQLTLADALASSGVDQLTADNERIFVLRKGEDLSKPYAYHLDASDPGALILATAFQLQPLDVVFVSTADIARWGRTMLLLMPSVNALWFLDRIAE
jgi:polysaccharide export outer membrane protein